ncbi:unnamed protein product [Caenorhabditis bovis]|uniref:Uncharacterized protein n=1 Tax=Caenorhabditis bovis TaxID=2654633 RepID=A0A8S1EZS6_9PELO|nr:unnamed protein product [Caenorhabditis bovis]
MTVPPCLIWKYPGRRLKLPSESCLLPLPRSGVAALEAFLYDTMGLFIPPHAEYLSDTEPSLINSEYFISLSNSQATRESEHSRRQNIRLKICTKLSQIISYNLTYLRKMHFDSGTKAFVCCKVWF